MKNKLVYLLLGAGAALRIAGLGSSSWWFDEAYSMLFARMPDILFGIRVEVGNFNNPLWHLIAWVSVHLFGANEIGIRLPSLLAGLVSLWLGWLITRKMTDNPLGQLSAVALFALLPYTLWMSQDARCYAVMSLLYLAGFYFGLQSRWMGYGACLGLLLYTHPIGIFYAAALALAILLYQWQAKKLVILSSLAGGVTYAIWFPITLQAPKFWNPPLKLGAVLSSFAQATFANTLLDYQLVVVGVIVISILAALVVFAWRHRHDRLSWSMMVWAMGPLLFMLAAAPLVSVIFYRTLSAMIIPMCIWLALMLTPKKLGWSMMIHYAWAVLLLVGLLAWSPALRGGNLRDMAQTITDLWQPGDVIYHDTGLSYVPFLLYMPDQPQYLLDEDLPTSGLQNRKIEAMLGIEQTALEDIPHKRAWIIYSRDWQLPQAAINRMEAYIQGAMLIGRIELMQVAPIDIYLLEE